MTHYRDAAAFLGRVLMASLFLGGAVQKGIDPGPAQDLLAGWGWPGWLVWPAALYNLVAGLALLAGVGTRAVAASLAAYCALTAFFHLVPQDPWQMTIFVKNFAISGGCLVLSAFGPGAWRLRRAHCGLG